MASTENSRYDVPIGVEIAAQWSWRLIVITITGLGLLWVVRFFSEITVPLAIALLGTALAAGAVDWLDRRGVPRLVAALVVVIGLLSIFFGALYVVGLQVASQFTDLRTKVLAGISDLQDWLYNGPLGLTDSQVQGYVDRLQEAVSNVGSSTAFDTAAAVGTSLTHFVAGFFIALFAMFFFLFEGERIWAFIVIFFPAGARERAHSSGVEAWHNLTSFVRATVLVALVDAIGISLGASLLGVPLALGIGVLVFLGAFVPLIGAAVSGFIAVVVALVALGPVKALFMLLVVVAVQQLEAHVLQPFLMGRFVAVHPLAIILAIAAGVTVAGVVGALVAVPLTAALNGVVRHLAHPPGVIEDDGLPPDPAAVLETDERQDS